MSVCARPHVAVIVLADQRRRFGRIGIEGRRGDHTIVRIGYRTRVARYRNDQFIRGRSSDEDKGLVASNDIFAFIDKGYRFFVTSDDVPLVGYVMIGIIRADVERYEIVGTLGFCVFRDGTRPA